MKRTFIDLSQPLNNLTPVYPGDPVVIISPVFSYDKEGLSVHGYQFGGHTGTHIDAATHFIKGGKNLDEYPLEKFSGEGKVIDARGYTIIDIDILKSIKIKKDSIVLFWTDYVNNSDPLFGSVSKGPTSAEATAGKPAASPSQGYRGDFSHPASTRFSADGYFHNFPILTEKLAGALVKMGVKMVGMDAPSFDSEPDFPVHKKLLGNDVLMLEGLCNLELVYKKKFRVYAFPIKVCTDGVPVRVAAEIY